MEFQEIKFIKDWLIALVKNDDKYMVILGKIGKIKFSAEQDTVSITSRYYELIDNIVTSMSSKIEIPLIAHNDKLFTIFGLNNKQEYETIKNVLEVVLCVKKI